MPPLSAASIEADVLALVDSLHALTRAARVPDDAGPPPPPRPGDPPPPPALVPALAERFVGAAASLAAAAVELRRRAALADAEGRAAAARAARSRTCASADVTMAGLAEIADEAAEMLQVRWEGGGGEGVAQPCADPHPLLQRLDAHLAASAAPPPSATADDGLDSLVAGMGGYFQ